MTDTPTVKDVDSLQTTIKNLQNLQKSMIPISNFVQQIAKLNTTIDLSVFRKIYHQSMIRELNAVKDERITAILGQVLTEYWLNIFIQNLFSNHWRARRRIPQAFYSCFPCP
ncbi:MAG: hypothetical protein EB153_09125, partial [Nitrosopumilaceae archaeon]|nr:hypothetical protein [Nitrosopumilaceae archaeon]